VNRAASMNNRFIYCITVSYSFHFGKRFFQSLDLVGRHYSVVADLLRLRAPLGNQPVAFSWRRRC
jgi:hypothetical protein